MASKMVVVGVPEKFAAPIKEQIVSSGKRYTYLCDMECEDNKTPYSTITFQDQKTAAGKLVKSGNALATNLIANLSAVKCDAVIKAYEAVNADAHVEEFMTFLRWLEVEYDEWFNTQYTGVDLHTWNTHIYVKVIPIFGDIFVALRLVYKSGMLCGFDNVEEMGNKVSICVNGGTVRAKVNTVKKSKMDDESFRKEMSILSELMETVIYYPMIEIIKDKSKSFSSSDYQALAKFPSYLIEIIDALQEKTVVASCHSDWLLDEPIFWSLIQKATFIRKTWYMVVQSQDRNAFFDLKTELAGDVDEWHKIEMDQPFDRVMSEMRNRKIEYLLSKNITPIPSDFGGLSGAVGFYKQVLDHYGVSIKVKDKTMASIGDKVADFVGRQRQNEQMIKSADEIIGNHGALCSHIHMAMSKKYIKSASTLTIGWDTARAQLSSDVGF